MKKLKYIFYTVLLLVTSLFSYMSISGKNINAIGLDLLSWIKDLSGNSVGFEEFETKESKVITHESWSELLGNNVDSLGHVNYYGFINEQIKFEDYLSLLSNNPPGKNWSADEKLAYWLNAYNAFTVKLILDYYPVESIKEIGGSMTMINSAWDIKFFKIGNVDFDLNTIEHEIIRKKFDEPRIHFAINCASVSCPKLRKEAYQSDILDNQLDDQVYTFLHDSSKNKINQNELTVSKIFDWFETDFNEHGGVSKFIQTYHKEFNENLRLNYLDYDWALND